MKNDISTDRHIYIQSYTFLNYESKNSDIVIGGSNRYLRDLGLYFHSKGYKVTYIQKTDKSYNINYEDWAQVVGLSAPNNSLGNIIFSYKAFKIIKKGIVCYGNMEDSIPFIHKNSFAIQHGIWWDYKTSKIKKIIQNLRIKYILKKVKVVVCVDTNFKNWFRTNYPQKKMLLDKMFYVHNYADTKIFKKTNTFNDLEIPLLLFPRRFDYKRGYEIFIKMCAELKRMNYKFDYLIVGDGKEQEKVINLFKKYKLDINKVIKSKFDEISKYYNKAYLTYIPTLWSEGTSLSAIESICCGCPVITTDVGGLGNIVISGFNGEMCNPEVSDFVRQTIKLLNNPIERNIMSDNCYSLRNSFCKEKWQEKIWNILKNNLIIN